MSILSLKHEIDYPESDGRPMGESDDHRDEILDLIAALKKRYMANADAYVAGNVFLYYEEGNPRAVVCPDVFLVRGVPKKKRRTYKLWLEGRPPSFVIEVTSRSSRQEDGEDKKNVYERLGVEEYFLHDPLGEYLLPRLRGFRLVGGRYRAMASNPDGSLESKVTGLTLRSEANNLRLQDAATGEPLLWVEEVQHRLEEETAARSAAEARAEQAEAELARLRKALEGSPTR
jgi:Uma2 family endonuclease